MEYRKLLESYFAAEEAGDVEGVVNLCDPAVVIRNAAQPEQYGHGGARRFASDFQSRTEQRQFVLLAVAQEGEIVFAWGDATLTFRTGVAFGPVITKRPFTVRLEGICRFKVTAAGRFAELDVYHETSTPFRLAQAAAE